MLRHVLRWLAYQVDPHPARVPVPPASVTIFEGGVTQSAATTLTRHGAIRP
jgi:hypothetical protein